MAGAEPAAAKVGAAARAAGLVGRAVRAVRVGKANLVLPARKVLAVLPVVAAALVDPAAVGNGVWV